MTNYDNWKTTPPNQSIPEWLIEEVYNLDPQSLIEKALESGLEESTIDELLEDLKESLVEELWERENA